MSFEHQAPIENQEPDLEENHIGWVENVIDSAKHVGKQVVGIGAFYAIIEGLKAHGIVDIDSQTVEMFIASAAGITAVNLMSRKKKNISA